MHLFRKLRKFEISFIKELISKYMLLRKKFDFKFVHVFSDHPLLQLHLTWKFYIDKKVSKTNQILIRKFLLLKMFQKINPNSIYGSFRDFKIF